MAIRTGLTTGVLLMTFGSATDAGGVPAYMRSVHQGHEPDPALVAEFERRYRLVGRSPLVEITLAQGRALQAELDGDFAPGRFLVAVGMLHSEPTIRRAVDDLMARGVHQVLAVTLAPQFSPLILSGYRQTLDRIAAATGVEIGLAGAWHAEPEFVASLAGRLVAALDSLPAAERNTAPVIFTAHSLPLRVIERDPGYIDQLTETAEAVAARVALPRHRWQFAYQSAGHSPEPWLKPDLVDLLPGLRAQGHREVVIAPLQFVADHLEILYDLDMAARDQAEAAGLGYRRIPMPNTDPAFIRALAAVVRREAAEPVH
ncbi:MAG TPA: ferrochelatase [Candidatus Limnocylindrales bacterium]|nr:ferrochelatase [Candidatus Limnocylindrales bacterium]